MKNDDGVGGSVPSLYVFEYMPNSVDAVRFKTDFVRFVNSLGVVAPLAVVGDCGPPFTQAGRSCLCSGAGPGDVSGVRSKGRLGLGR